MPAKPLTADYYENQSSFGAPGRKRFREIFGDAMPTDETLLEYTRAVKDNCGVDWCTFLVHDMLSPDQKSFYYTRYPQERAAWEKKRTDAQTIYLAAVDAATTDYIRQSLDTFREAWNLPLCGPRKAPPATAVMAS